MTRPNDITPELWTEWEEGFEKSKTSGEQALLLTLSPTREPFFKELWLTGCWISYEMEKLGATDEEVTNAQFASGQIATTAPDEEHLWLGAQAVLDRYKTGNPYNAGDELAQELAPETISQMSDEELAAHATELTGEDMGPDFIKMARESAKEHGFKFTVGEEVVVPSEKDDD